MTGFWKSLSRPFWAMAPMEDVTDTVFRRIVASVGKPDVCFTEFTNVDAIVYAVRNAQKSVLELPVSLRSPGSLRADFASIPALQRLYFSESERPIVAQIWGTDPQKFYEAPKIIKKLGFDGIDINFGCPVRDVVKIGACSAMIGKNSQVAEIIAAVKEGSKLPVSIKTRIGFKAIVTEEWIGFLLGQGLAAITVHGRTAVELSSVPAHWEEIGKAVSLRDQSESETLIVGNGDVKSLEEAREKVREYGVDGVMIGRGVLENPAIFNSKPACRSGRFLILNRTQKLKLLNQHLKLWEETWGEHKNFAAFKKYVKVYVRDFEGAGELRARLMNAASYSDLRQILG